TTLYSTIRVCKLLLRRRVDVIHPVHFLWLLYDRDVEIHDDRFLTAAHEHARERLIVVRVDLLVRNVWRHVDEVAGAGFRDELELIAPAHPRLSADDVDHAFHRAVMVRAGFRLRMDHHGAGPQLFG